MNGMGKPAGDLQTWVYRTALDVWQSGSTGGSSDTTVTTGGSIQYHDLTYSPIALWQLSGSLADSSTFVSNLTCSVGNTRYTNMGKGLRGIGFDGLTMLSLTASMPRAVAIAMTGSVTIEMLTTIEPQAATQVLFAAAGLSGDVDGSENILYQFSIGANGVIDYFAETAGGTNVQATTINVVPFNTLCHLAQTRDNSGVIRTYINGALLETSAATTLITTGTVNPSSARFQIGAAPGGSFATATAPSTNTSIASVKIVGRALTEGEIYAEYQRTLGNLYQVTNLPIVSGSIFTRRVAPDSLDAAVWLFNEASGSSVYANTGVSSSLAMTGTVVGAYTGARQFFGNVGETRSSGYFAASGSATMHPTGSLSQLFTVSTWVNVKSYVNFAKLIIKEWHPNVWTSPFYNGIGLLNTGDGRWEIAHINTAGAGIYPNTPTGEDFGKIPLNEWCHIGYTYDGAAIKGYLNGVMVISASRSGDTGWGFNGDGGLWQVGGHGQQLAEYGNCFVTDARVAFGVARNQRWFADVYANGIGFFTGTIGTIPGITSSLSRTAPDSFTLHNWVLNDSGSTYTDSGTGANASLTNITTPVVSGEVGIFNDAAYFTPSSAAQSANAVGTPTSTTQISIHGWVKVRAFTNSGPRLITRGYNTTFASPQFISLEIYLASTTGAVGVQWTSAGSLKSPAAAGTRGILIPGVWYHVAATLNVVGSNMIVCTYVNGALVSQTSTASGGIDWNGASAGPWSLGGATGTLAGFCLDGWLHDWRVDDGIVRTPDYFKTLYKKANGLPY